MAYLIECDRCGNTRSVTSTSDIPSKWLQFNQMWRGSGIGADKPIDGGVFCQSCADDLERWRKPIPQAKPIPAEAFKTFAQIGGSP